jgi:Glycosyl transferase family 2
MKVSVVIPTHNRAHLFKRSLEAYARSTFKDFEILLLDDSSNDRTEYCCRELAPSLGLDLKQLWFHKPPGKGFRDGACQINYGIRAAAGDLIVTTCPEVMPGTTTLQEMVSHFENYGWKRTDWVSAKCYLLSREHQEQLDSVEWKALGPAAAVRQLPGFYKAPSAEYTGAAFYENRSVDQCALYSASIFCGMTRAGWRWIGGFPESETWGAPDPSFLAERTRRGILSYSLREPDSTCVHQNHDECGTPRNPETCLAHLVTGPWDHIRW